MIFWNYLVAYKKSVLVAPFIYYVFAIRIQNLEEQGGGGDENAGVLTQIKTPMSHHHPLPMLYPKSCCFLFS